MLVKPMLEFDAHNDAPAFATADETARFLNLSRSMVFKEIEAGNIPAVRFGRCVRVPWSFLKRLAEGK